MIGIVNYEMGNLLSVYSALDHLGESVCICSHPEELASVDKIIIPGVGAFNDCITRLVDTGFSEALEENVIKNAKPTLGICLGMQVMACQSYEDGIYKGLGWFNADVIKLHPDNSSLRVPNIGWNEVTYRDRIFLFNDLPEKSDFYFVHSYYMQCHQPEDVVASYQYGHSVTAAIVKNNIAATQFHPEKSQDYGLKVLENFIKWNP